MSGYENGAPGSITPTPQGPLLVRELCSPKLELSVVVPTYNEAKNVAELVDALERSLRESLGPGSFEVIVVDDNSPDETWRVAQELAAARPYLRVIRRQGERGLSTAVIRGWQAAEGAILAVIDGDLQHPPEVIARLFAKIREGADLAVGSRNIEGGGVSDWSLLRRMLSRGAQVVGLLILPGVLGRVSDPMSGCFALKREAISGVTLNPLGYKILLEVVGRGRIGRVAEVGYVFRERVVGASKVTSKVYFEYLGHLVRLRFATLPTLRFVKFCLVGLSGVAVDMATLYFLSDPTQLGLGLTRSKIVAAELAIANNFLWNDAWTFREVSSKQPNASSRWRRFLRFNVVCTLGLVLNLIMLNMMFNVFGWNRYVANAIAIGIVTLWNFWLNSRISWFQPET
jgi:dolichol-phosphate mannosyltransferase